MKKISLFILLSLLIFGLYGCSLDYPKYEGEINGYQLYRYEEFGTTINCERISPWGVFLKYEDEYYITKSFGNCSSTTLYIRESSEYITLTVALEEGIIELDDVLNHEWEFSIHKAFDIIGNIFIERIEVTKENSTEDNYIITDVDEISEIKMNWAFYELFIEDFDYGEEDVISYITIYDIEGNIYHFELRTNGLLYIEGNMFNEFYDSRFYRVLREGFEE